jgi:hypothetical protein
MMNCAHVEARNPSIFGHSVLMKNVHLVPSNDYKCMMDFTTDHAAITQNCAAHDQLNGAEFTEMG